MKTKEKAVRLMGTFVLMVVLMFGVAPRGTSAAGLAGPNVPTPYNDYGDLPDTYNMTTNAQNGAYHNAFNGPRLGALIDPEYNGQPNATATGDDLNGSDDEDGVLRSYPWGSEFWTNGRGEITVTVTGAGCLMGWLDFGGALMADGANPGKPGLGVDGVFSDTIRIYSYVTPTDYTTYSEIIVNNLYVVNGTQTIQFVLPVDAATYPMYARFRLSEANDGVCDNPTPLTGWGPPGEVEDYYWVFKSSAVTLQGFSAASSTDNNSILLVLSVIGLGSLTLLWKARRRRVQS